MAAESRQRSTVVVVDADPVGRHAVERILQRAGYEVVAVSSFPAAKRLLDDQAVRLLITSVKLGAYNGLHLILRTQAQRPDIATVLTTVGPDPVLERDVRRQGVTCLAKPFTSAALLDAISRSQRSRPVDGASPGPSAVTDIP